MFGDQKALTRGGLRAYHLSDPEGSRHMLAQSLGEYGAAGSFGSNLQAAIYSARGWLADLGPTTWIIAAAVILGVVFLRKR